MTKPAKPARMIVPRKSDIPYPEQAKARPRTPLNILKRPPKLERMKPLTDAEREAA